MKSVFFWVVLMLIYGGAYASSQSTMDDLKKVEQQLAQEKQTQLESQRKAAQLSQEVKEVQGDLVSTAKKIQTQENKLSDLEDQKKEYEGQEKELQEKLSLSDKQLYRIMKGMQTLALRPPELLFTQKKAPVQMMRSRLMMKYALPVIGQMEEQMRLDLEALAKTRTKIDTRVGQIRQTHSDLTEQNEKMNRLLQQKKIMQAQYTSDYEQSKKKAQALALKAQDLKDLLKKLEEEQKQRQVKRPPMVAGQGLFARSYGRLSWPTKGILTQPFGTTSDSGAHTKGVLFKTRPLAHVITPFDGVVLFAGPFKNYGQLLIIDHGDEYMMVLAGMGQINVAVGQELLAGEPIGQMGQNYTDLYLEMRHQGQAIDPEPWFYQGGRK